jgi:hypothetical protein
MYGSTLLFEPGTATIPSGTVSPGLGLMRVASVNFWL